MVLIVVESGATVQLRVASGPTCPPESVACTVNVWPPETSPLRLSELVQSVNVAAPLNLHMKVVEALAGAEEKANVAVVIFVDAASFTVA